MSEFAEFGNSTISVSEINVVLPLISLMAAHFVVSAFKLVSDLDSTSVMKFHRMASEYFLEMSHRSSVPPKKSRINHNIGYIVLEKPESEIFNVLNTNAKVMIAVYRVDASDPQPPEFFSKLVFPPSISVFLVLLFEDSKYVHPVNPSAEVAAKCFMLYRPISRMPLKIFSAMSYGGKDGAKWSWVSEERNWNFFKETRNMTGINITIAMVTRVEKQKFLDQFWKNKASFFWRLMQDYLKFRVNIHFSLLTAQTKKKVTRIYFRLLSTIADGLAILPVMSPDRNDFVDFIPTGCDSKYQLMIKAPEYVISWRSIFKPLAQESWICTGAIILLTSVTLRIVTLKQNSSGLSLSGCCLTVLGFVCSQGSTIIPKSCAARLVCYTALSFSILMYQFYTSNFYSMLSTKEVKLPFTSIEQFIAKRTHSLFIHPETAMFNYIKNAKNGTLKQLWDEFLKDNPQSQMDMVGRVKALSDVCKGKGAILGLPFQTVYFKELTCELVCVNSGYFPTNIVTVIRKNFPFKSQFKLVHLRSLETGLSHRFRDEYLSSRLRHESKATVTNEPVSLEHVAFLFGFQAAFILFSLVILVFEIIASKAAKTKK